jgi:hypothetical protein
MLLLVAVDKALPVPTPAAVLLLLPLPLVVDKTLPVPTPAAVLLLLLLLVVDHTPVEVLFCISSNVRLCCGSALSSFLFMATIAATACSWFRSFSPAAIN